MLKRYLMPLNLQLFSADTGGAGGTKTQDDIDLKKLQQDFTDSWKSLKTLLDQQADEMRAHGETSTKTATSIQAIEAKIKSYETELKGITDKYKDLETKMNRPDLGGKERPKTFGEKFIEGESYKAGNVLTARMEYKGFFRKDLDSTTAHGGILVDPQRIGGMFAQPDARFTMRQLLNATGTTSNAIEYILETGFVNASAIAVEKSLKPTSDITFDIESATVKTIAHWIPATRQIVADAPMLRNYIDGRLMYGLEATEEAQLLYGTGVGDNIAGIMTNANIQVMPQRADATTTVVDHLRRAMTRAVLAGYPMTGIVLHPNDWTEIELLKGTDGHYIWININTGGDARLWRVPVVESTSINEGEFLAGAFGLGAQIWDREQANIRVSEHHTDYFARNMIAILAEERLALTVYRPEAFIKGSLAPVAV
jgi:HK97 family phage major capsid protein